MKFNTVAEAETALEKYYGITEKVIGKDITVGRTEKLMKHLGNPERKLRAVHVAGTSGKTSTAYYIATLLQSSGLRVGLTVSPHIDSITERVQLNGKPISDKKFCSYLAEFLEIIDDIEDAPTWSECIIGFAFWAFAKEKLDYIVVETMLGGLHDATNILTRADKLCVITDIGFDHTSILGNRIEQIAYQKAGIIHDNNDVLLFEQGTEIMQVVRYWASQQEETEVYTFEQSMLDKVYKGRFVPRLPDYQKRNWLLAFAAYLFLARRDKFEACSLEDMRKTQKLQVPARMDIRKVHTSFVIMDGAHNEQKMRAFVQSFQSLYPDNKVPVLLAAKQGKEIEAIAPLVAEIASEVVVTTFSKIQDLPITSMKVNKVADALKRAGIARVESIADQEKAYKHFMAKPSELKIITGSFFLIAQVRGNHSELR